MIFRLFPIVFLKLLTYNRNVVGAVLVAVKIMIFRSAVNEIQRITRLFTEEDLYRSETRTLFLNRKGEIAYEKTG